MITDVIIPTYKPDDRLVNIINALKKQTCPPRKVILVNTDTDDYEGLEKLNGYDKIADVIKLLHISIEEFDHGYSRNKGAAVSDADYLLYMTQDAIPFDKCLIEKLQKAFTDEKVASCYARQVIGEDASLAEEFSRQFNYPDTSSVKSLDDKSRLGIKTYFCSNACAMYKRDIFMSLGMFPENMIFNEDMVFAHKVIESGYKIAYAADAKVIHYHNYTSMQQFHRNFDLAVSQAMHKEVFESVSSEAEGSSYAKSALKYFKEKGKILYFIPFAFTCGCRLFGYKLGKKYDKLPRSFVLWCTMSPNFFIRNWR